MLAKPIVEFPMTIHPKYDAADPAQDTVQSQSGDSASEVQLPAYGEATLGTNWIGLYTLYMKEVRRFMKVQLQTVWGPALTTLLFLAIFTLALGRGGRTEMGVPFADFLAPGLIVMGMIQNSFANSSFSLLVGKVQGTIVDYLTAADFRCRTDAGDGWFSGNARLYGGSCGLAGNGALAGSFGDARCFAGRDTLWFSRGRACFFIRNIDFDLGREIRSRCRRDQLHHRAARPAIGTFYSIDVWHRAFRRSVTSTRFSISSRAFATAFWAVRIQMS